MKKYALLLISLILSLAMVGCGPSASPKAEEAGHNHEGEENLLELTSQQRAQIGLSVEKAGPGTIVKELLLPGEVRLNEERSALVALKASGRIVRIEASLGDSVRAGETLALLESDQLADAQAEYLERLRSRDLSKKTFQRKETLKSEHVAGEAEWMEAEAAYKNGENLLEASRRRLLLLGLSSAEIAALSQQPPSKMGLYLLKAPIGGRVVGREITLGDNLEAGTTVFTLADTSLLWVDLSLTSDLQGFVKEGDEAWIEGEDGTREKCRISLISPTLDPSTRTLTLRLELKNPKGFWKPGSYVSGSLRSGERAVPLLVPRSSVQILEGNPVVFVPEGHGFHAHPVVLGERDGEHVEILSGIASGTPVVVRGAFELKAAAVTSSLGSHAGHNH